MLICQDCYACSLLVRSRDRDHKLQDRDLVKTSRPRPRLHQKIWDRELKVQDWDYRLENLSGSVLLKYFHNFLKKCDHHLQAELFRFYGNFLHALVFLNLQIQQTENTLNYRALSLHIVGAKSQDGAFKASRQIDLIPSLKTNRLDIDTSIENETKSRDSIAADYIS